LACADEFYIGFHAFTVISRTTTWTRG
jgi:hypothetical protein